MMASQPVSQSVADDEGEKKTSGPTTELVARLPTVARFYRFYSRLRNSSLWEVTDEEARRQKRSAAVVMSGCSIRRADGTDIAAGCIRSRFSAARQSSISLSVAAAYGPAASRTLARGMGKGGRHLRMLQHI